MHLLLVPLKLEAAPDTEVYIKLQDLSFQQICKNEVCRNEQMRMWLVQAESYSHFLSSDFFNPFSSFY